MKKHSILTNHGLSLIEAIVASGLLAMIAIAGTSLSQISTNSSKYSDQKNEFESLSSLIRERLKYEITCRQSIGDTSGLNLKIDNSVFSDQLSTTFDPSTPDNGWNISMKIPGIQSGQELIGDTISKDTTIPGRKMKIDLLRLTDGSRYVNAAGELVYTAMLYLGASQINGMKYQPHLITSVNMTVDGSGDIVKCSSSSEPSLSQVCEEMGCKFDPSATPPCQCITTQVICATPGYYPTAFKNGLPDCRPLGGKDCEGDTFLVGIGIERSICAPTPSKPTCSPVGSYYYWNSIPSFDTSVFPPILTWKGQWDPYDVPSWSLKDVNPSWNEDMDLGLPNNFNTSLGNNFYQYGSRIISCGKYTPPPTTSTTAPPSTTSTTTTTTLASTPTTTPPSSSTSTTTTSTTTSTTIPPSVTCSSGSLQSFSYTISKCADPGNTGTRPSSPFTNNVGSCSNLSGSLGTDSYCEDTIYNADQCIPPGASNSAPAIFGTWSACVSTTPTTLPPSGPACVCYSNKVKTGGTVEVYSYCEWAEDPEGFCKNLKGQNGNMQCGRTTKTKSQCN